MIDIKKFIDELSFSLKKNELEQEELFLEEYRLTPLGVREEQKTNG